MYSKLQYISQGITSGEQLDNIHNALDAGCEWIQLRFKNANPNEFSDVAEQVKKKCESYNATFIINDNVKLVKKIDAQGVHLGLEDMSVLQARLIIGENKIIGGTANTLLDVKRRIDENCNYIGLGPFRITSTKTNLSPVLGLDGYKNIMQEILKYNTPIPIYAIGGISIDDITSIINTGVYGIAASGMITNHSNKKKLLQNFNSLLYSGIFPLSPLSEKGAY